MIGLNESKKRNLRMPALRGLKEPSLNHGSRDSHDVVSVAKDRLVHAREKAHWKEEVAVLRSEMSRSALIVVVQIGIRVLYSYFIPSISPKLPGTIKSLSHLTQRFYLTAWNAKKTPCLRQNGLRASEILRHRSKSRAWTSKSRGQRRRVSGCHELLEV